MDPTELPEGAAHPAIVNQPESVGDSVLIAQPPKKDQQEGKELRCGACLFKLPGHVQPASFDLPYESELVPNDAQKGYVRHQVPKIDISRSAQRGCPVCRILWPWSQAQRVRELEWDCGRLAAVGLNPSGVGFYEDGFQLFSPVASASLPHLLKTHPFLNVGGVPTGDTRSTEAFGKISGWIKRCEDQHQRCAANELKYMPKRIVYIEDYRSLNIRLIENADKLPPQPYVCLSHRWMPETGASGLTREWCAVFQRRIPKEKIYGLLVDALEIAHRLGFRYLWVDCFCIYQDDLHDWNQQASEMCSIYENAFLTISALSCDADQGRERIFDQYMPTDCLLLGEFDGREVFLRHVTRYSHPFEAMPVSWQSNLQPSEMFPLSKRGWAYQERLLSRKIVHFTTQELIWECREAHWCECRYREQLWDQVKRKEASVVDLRWRTLVGDYSQTKLSFESDKLPALAGIAKRFNQTLGWTFLAGLWEEDLMSELIWVTRHPKVYSSYIRQKLPSWSWASVDSSVFFWSVGQDMIRLVTSDVVLGENPFGVPESASLILEGSCAPALLIHGTEIQRDISLFSKLAGWSRQDEHGSSILKIGDEYVSVRPDYLFTALGDGFIASGTEVLFMVSKLRDAKLHGLVMLCINPLTAIYERIGVGTSIDLDYPFPTDQLKDFWSTKLITLV